VPESGSPCVGTSSLLPVVPQERPSSEGRFYSGPETANLGGPSPPPLCIERSAVRHARGRSGVPYPVVYWIGINPERSALQTYFPTVSFLAFT
jgi:hypothetical protein